MCDVSSEPDNNITYLWVRRRGSFSDHQVLSKGGIVTGDNPYIPIPGMIDLVPLIIDINSNYSSSYSTNDILNSNNRNRNFSGKYANGMVGSPQSVYQSKIKSYLTSTQKLSSRSRGKFSIPFPDLPFVESSDVFEGKIDPGDSRRSFLTLMASEESTFLCYAKNTEGRSRVPCAFTIAVVGETFFLYV